MFYLTKRQDENQCTPGDTCMVLADFFGIPAGSIGTVDEVYDGGVMIRWDPPMDKSDGFHRDELEYLAFGSMKHPKVDPEVHNTTIHK